MRAKRSKKYRKLMHQYELTFGFHEPYQVLVDSNFLRAVHQFKMELIPALERTLQGKAKPLLSKCSLAAIMAAQPINPKTNKPYRPWHLPPPTELPLRHCSHNNDDAPIDEVECLLSLLCPNTDTMRNKEHYILATAEPVALPHDDVKSDNPKTRRQAEALMDERNEKALALRSAARAVPGVPIIYVKRSVMVLEPFSTPSEKVRLGVEKSKFKIGMEAALDVVSGLKRKREDEEEGPSATSKDRHAKKAKAPNPLSIKKPKKREKPKPEEQGKKKEKKQDQEQEQESRDDGAEDKTADAEGEQSAKKKRKRKHKSAKSGVGAVEVANGSGPEEVPASADD